MAKTFKNLYPQICSLENLYEAARKTRKLKTRRESTEFFELHKERYIRQLRGALLSEEWKPSAYRVFKIYDPRERTISAAPYRDRVVHHALCNVIAPLIERRFVFDSYSCRIGKGTTAARERCRKYTDIFSYVLKCDVRKFFQSLDHEILLSKLNKVIGCRSTLGLCRKIISSSVDREIDPVIFEGDSSLSVLERKRGLPIGNLTSQLWGNLYLDAMDHYILEQLRPRGYARYTDDFLLWANTKNELQEMRQQIESFIANDRLLLQERKTRVFPCRIGVPYLGFRFFPGKKPRLTGEAKRRFEKRCRRQIVLELGTLRYFLDRITGLQDKRL